MTENELKKNYLLMTSIPLMDVTETEVRNLGKVVMLLLQSALKEFGTEKWMDINMKCRELSEIEFQLKLMGNVVNVGLNSLMPILSIIPTDPIFNTRKRSLKKMHNYELRIWDVDEETQKHVSIQIKMPERNWNALKWELTHSSAYFSRQLAAEIEQKEKEFEKEWAKL